MDYMTIINRLAEKRLSLGLGENDLAIRAGLSQSSVHRILNGQSVASFKNLSQLAQALGVTIGIVEDISPETMIYNRAKSRAEAVAAMTQATSQLEGQGLSEREQEELIRKITREILAEETKKR